jgi:Glutathione-dependent formaldehyde-activating enzyme
MEGGCACRQIRYRLVGTPLIVHACHCRWCQRETGTAHALNALYEADRVVHTAGEPELVLICRHSPEVGAVRGKPHVRICAGGGEQSPSLVRCRHLPGTEAMEG